MPTCRATASAWADFVKANGESLYRPAWLALQQRNNDRRVHSTRQEGPQRHIRQRLQPDRFAELGLQQAHSFGPGLHRFGQRPPALHLRIAERLSRSLWLCRNVNRRLTLHREQATGFQLEDAFVDGARRWHVYEA